MRHKEEHIKGVIALTFILSVAICLSVEGMTVHNSKDSFRQEEHFL